MRITKLVGLSLLGAPLLVARGTAGGTNDAGVTPPSPGAASRPPQGTGGATAGAPGAAGTQLGQPGAAAR